MRRAHRGFTLVEMLVAISVAALLVTLVYGAVRIGQRSADALDTQSEAAEVMRIGWQYLHDAIARARPVGDPVAPDNRTSFIGGPDHLEFVADLPAYIGLGGLTRISLRRSATQHGEQLLLSRQRFGQQASEAPSDDDIEQAVLVEDLDGLKIAYFGRDRTAEMPSWRGYWENAETLPNLVSIVVTPAGGRAWPMLIARPLTGNTPLDETALPSDGEFPFESDGLPE